MKQLTEYLLRANTHLLAEKAKRAENKTQDTNSLFTAAGEIQGEYPPFAASFGATILRSGLMPAIFLYAEKSGAGKSKIPLTNLFLAMLQPEGADPHFDTLLDYAQHHRLHDELRLRRRILDASIAAKLALRSFPVQGKNKVA